MRARRGEKGYSILDDLFKRETGLILGYLSGGQKALCSQKAPIENE